jgi:hypothetical protein
LSSNFYMAILDKNKNELIHEFVCHEIDPIFKLQIKSRFACFFFS